MDKGVVSVSYNRKIDDKLVVYISNGTVDMWYDLIPLVTGYFPLQHGNGTYRLKVAREINNTGSYGVLFSDEILLNLPNDTLVYTTSITEIFWTEGMAAIIFAYDRTADASYEWDMVVSLYDYMVKQYRYDYEKIKSIRNVWPGYIPDIEVVFYDQKIICHDYAVLFASMLRSLNIPAKLVKGYCENADGYHAWNEVYNPDTDKWVLIDVTFDAWYFDKGIGYEMEKNPDTYYPNHEF